jgi:hypothetical protein
MLLVMFTVSDRIIAFFSTLALSIIFGLGPEYLEYLSRAISKLVV